MALNSSGPISFGGATTGQSINLELGVSATAVASIDSASFRTLAGVPSGAISVSNFYGKSNTLTGQQTYTTAGSYSFVIPAGVSSITVLAVGGGGGSVGAYGPFSKDAYGGGGASGGALAYYNNYSVTPGQSVAIVVGAGGVGESNLVDGRVGNPSSVAYGGTTIISAGGGLGGKSISNTPPNGGTATGTSGFVGYSGGIGSAAGGESPGCGGAGAAGYSGAGGRGGGADPATSGTGGGGGGGNKSTTNTLGGGGGGGVGILGQGSNGAAASGDVGGGGGGGSGGANGASRSSGNGGVGGAYGAGGGGGGARGGYTVGGSGGVGAVRILYPGSTRSYPSTNTGNL